MTECTDSAMSTRLMSVAGILSMQSLKLHVVLSRGRTGKLSCTVVE